MRTIKLISVLMLAAIMSAPTYAQEPEKEKEKTEKKEGKKKKKPSKFGNFMRRMGESATGINMSTETFFSLPLEAQMMVDVTFVSCVGEKETGDVSLIFKMTPKVDLESESHFDDESKGADNAGGNYEGILHYNYFGEEAKTAGIPVMFTYTFKSVPNTTPQFEVATVPFYLRSTGGDLCHSGNSAPMQIRNIPIDWQSIAQADGSYIDFFNECEEWVDIEVENCIGDSKTGIITLTLITTAKQDLENFNMGSDDDKDLKAYDIDNNAYLGIGDKSNPSYREPIQKGMKAKYYHHYKVPGSTTTMKLFILPFDIGTENYTRRTAMGKYSSGIQVNNVPVVWK